MVASHGPQGEPACPVCETRQWTSVFEARDMYTDRPVAVVRCAACDLLRTDDDTPPERLGQLYHYDGGADAALRMRGPAETLMRWLRRRRKRDVTQGRGQGGRILDVGCGRGAMLEALAEAGWDVYGTEIDAAVGQSAARSLEGRIRFGDLLSVDFSDVAPFEVITFWHVLEHVADPRATLARARRLLADGGRILVAVPNADSWQARWFGRRWLHLDVPRHRWHFSVGTLEALGRQVGLAVERVDHFSAEYGPFGLLQSALCSVGLGHRLYTDLLKARSGRPLMARPVFWAHVGLAAPIVAAGALAWPVEMAAAAVRRGGSISMTFRLR